MHIFNASIAILLALFEDDIWTIPGRLSIFDGQRFVWCSRIYKTILFIIYNISRLFLENHTPKFYHLGRKIAAGRLPRKRVTIRYQRS